METTTYKGLNVNLDQPSQVEFNRRKNVQQDQRLASLESNVNKIITQVPAGYLPRAYYGLVRGPQTYRFVNNYVFNVDNLDGVDGDAYGLLSTVETVSYINAIATQINSNQLKIVIPGDYTVPVEEFNLVNQRTGSVVPITLSSVLSLQDASYLGQYDANNNIGKQITVLYDYEFNDVNVTFASVDYSGDGIYNWVKIGSFINGADGRSIYAVTQNTAQAVFNVVRINDLVVAGEAIDYNGTVLDTGDVKLVANANPLVLENKGNIRGASGAPGATGPRGIDGVNGLTPEIVGGYWHIGDVNTGVKAVGVDGTDGADGKSFNIQSGLYSSPANVGNAGNTDAEGNLLLTLPTLPQQTIEGKGYIVYDPITTPLQPYYDLYFANNGDATWTIIHPFNGLNGRNGTDGHTPYIQNNNWFINGNNTGVPATGPQGPKGDKGVNYMGEWIEENEYHEDDLVTYQGSSYICIQAHSNNTTAPSIDANNWNLFASKGDPGAIGPTGSTGATGAVPNISVSAVALAAGEQPTATRSGTNENPIITFGIPGGGGGSQELKVYTIPQYTQNTGAVINDYFTNHNLQYITIKPNSKYSSTVYKTVISGDTITQTSATEGVLENIEHRFYPTGYGGGQFNAVGSVRNSTVANFNFREATFYSASGAGIYLTDIEQSTSNLTIKYSTVYWNYSNVGSSESYGCQVKLYYYD